jgi:O-acetyl-ADP-ribose deacetylase
LIAILAELAINPVLKEIQLPGEATLQLVQGDLTDERVEAIVNAANAYLQHGGGVAGAISHRGGVQIQAESNDWVRLHGLVSHAHPAYTGAGKLPCRYVIHAVGPVWGEGDEDNILKEAICGSLDVAERLNLASLSFPAISTGIYGFPKGRAARIMLETFRSYFAKAERSNIRIVRIVLIDPASLAAFCAVWNAFDWATAE